MELFFLGSGGGRVVLDQMLLATGGFRVNCQNFKMHCEPGPGALIQSLNYGQKPKDLDAIFCSHDHLDHCNDANVMVEAMTFGSWNKKRGYLIASKTILEGEGEFEKFVPEYFKKMVLQAKPLSAGEEFEFKGLDAKIIGTKTLHEDPTAIGFKLYAEGKVLGYTADTQIFDGLWRQYEGCDGLVANCLRPNRDKFPFHLAADEIIDGVNSMKKKPSQIILSHLGSKILDANPKKQSEKMEKATGIQTTVAHEGVKIKI